MKVFTLRLSLQIRDLLKYKEIYIKAIQSISQKVSVSFTSRTIMASVITRHICNTIRHFSTGPPMYERARVVAAPLRAKKQAKSSEAGNTRKFIDWRKVRVQGIVLETISH